MKVLKFGGTSVQFHDNMKQVKNIISDMQNEQLLIVLSACRGTTDNLLKLAEASANNHSDLMQSLFNEIKNHHLELITNLKLDNEFNVNVINDVNSILNQIENMCEGIRLLKELTIRTRATLVANGELLSTAILSNYLKSCGINNVLLDAREIMKLYYSNADSLVNFEKTSENIKKAFTQNLYSGFNIQIIQGFIGSDPMNNTAVLSRGGSDYSAAVFGAELQAEEIQIWTDVSGIFSTDPRFFSNAKTIERMTFSEVKELSAFGAKVLHPDTVKPAIVANIPVRVLNTHSPQENGTLLTNNIEESISQIDAITMLKSLNIFSITIPSERERKSEVIRKISECMNQTSGNYFLISQGISEIKIITDNISRLSSTFSKNYLTSNLSDVAVLCLVGKNLTYSSNSKLLNNISNIIFKYNIEMLEIINNNAIYIAMNTLENSNSLYEELHNFIINSI